jgi:excisionase family DNA binding protein
VDTETQPGADSDKKRQTRRWSQAAPASPDARLLTYEQTAALLSITSRGVRYFVETGRLASVRIGRARRVRREEIDRIAREGL